MMFINTCLVATSAQPTSRNERTEFKRHCVVVTLSRGLCDTKESPKNSSGNPDRLREHLTIHTHRLIALNAFKFFRLNGGDNDKDMKSACCCCLWLNSKCNFCFSRTFSYFSMVVSRRAASSNDCVCFSAPMCLAKSDAGADGRSIENL